MGTPCNCYCPKFSVEVPFVGVLCGQASGVEILLCEGGDVELGARTSKHILLFALDPLTLTLYLFTLCFASFHIDQSYLYVWLGCVHHLLLVSCVIAISF